MRLLGEASRGSSQLLGQGGMTAGENRVDFGLDG